MIIHSIIRCVVHWRIHRLFITASVQQLSSTSTLLHRFLEHFPIHFPCHLLQSRQSFSCFLSVIILFPPMCSSSLTSCSVSTFSPFPPLSTSPSQSSGDSPSNPVQIVPSCRMDTPMPSMYSLLSFCTTIINHMCSLIFSQYCWLPIYFICLYPLYSSQSFISPIVVPPYNPYIIEWCLGVYRLVYTMDGSNVIFINTSCIHLNMHVGGGHYHECKQSHVISYTIL